MVVRFRFCSQEAMLFLCVGEECRCHPASLIRLRSDQIENVVTVKQHHACNRAVHLDHPKEFLTALVTYPLQITLRIEVSGGELNVIPRCPQGGLNHPTFTPAGEGRGDYHAPLSSLCETRP